ncbi:MAG: hypothetical protein Q8N99_07270 [Nanoarchaeota archaeon]|nr:hypothetical protein [Nanoarchaeota archaeon]
MANTNTPRIERVKKVWTLDAKLWVPHKEEEIAFPTPSFGPDIYQSVGQVILGNGLKVPTGDYTASLLHSIYCNPKVKDAEFQNVRDLMKSNWIWVYVVKVYTDKGNYAIQDTKARGRSIDTPLSELEKMILKKNGAREIGRFRFSEDGRVSFAPKGTYKFGKHTHQSLSEDGDVIITYGIDGAKKLGEVSSRFRFHPITDGVEVLEGNAPKLRVSAINRYDVRLHVYGDDFGVSDIGCAFGVL